MRFVVCGDLLFSSRNLAKRLDQRIVRMLQEADVCFGNAEFCTPKRTTAPAIGRGYITSVDPGTLDEFGALNIKMVGFAHNHTGDFGVQGIVDTIEAAKARGLHALGIGYSLDEARRAHFEDTPTGRVGVVAAASTRSEIFAGSNPGNGVAARPGSSPLRWGRAFVLPEEEFKQLERIDTMLGTAESRKITQEIETFKPEGPGRFKFGSLFEGSLMIERGERAYVRTYADPNDERELLRRITDASKRSTFTLCALHTHEGVNENWFSDDAPEFIESFARKAIDAGASAFVGHGAHFLRGVEIYKGRPIFYNLGSLIMEFESGESIICPEMYEAYGYSSAELPSTLHGNRVKDAEGNFIGFASLRKFSENAYVVFDIDETGGFTYSIVPIDLDMRREQPIKRGLPVLADADSGRRIAERLEKISVRYGTKFSYDESCGTISVRP